MAGPGAEKPVEQDASAQELEDGASFKTGKTYKVTVLPTGHLHAVLLDWTGTQPIKKKPVLAKGPKGKHEKSFELETDATGAIKKAGVLLGEYLLEIDGKHLTRVPAVLHADEVHYQAVYGVGGPGVLDEDPPGPDPKPPEPDEHFFKCSNIEGPHFEFDSSFVRPSVADSLRPIAAALEEDPKRQAFLFGHTDKAGTDEYNKALSERRARAVFALLTHDVGAWEELAKKESWGDRPIQKMLVHLGYDAGALKKFQKDNALQDDGIAGPKTRAKLFESYFKKLHSPAFAPERFADFRYMGCSEFNPLVDTEAPEEQNRRVVAFVFTEKAKPKALPCKLGDLAPCRQSFKGAPGGRVATFRCQVFDDISERCRCEKPGLPSAVPFELQIAVEADESALVILEGGHEVNRIPAGVATDMGGGVRGFDLQHLEDKKTYRLEVRAQDGSLLSAWTLAPGEYHRASEKGDREALARAFGPLPTI